MTHWFPKYQDDIKVSNAVQNTVPGDCTKINTGSLIKWIIQGWCICHHVYHSGECTVGRQFMPFVTVKYLCMLCLLSYWHTNETLITEWKRQLDSENRKQKH